MQIFELKIGAVLDSKKILDGWIHVFDFLSVPSQAMSYIIWTKTFNYIILLQISLLLYKDSKSKLFDFKK